MDTFLHILTQAIGFVFNTTNTSIVDYFYFQWHHLWDLFYSHCFQWWGLMLLLLTTMCFFFLFLLTTIMEHFFVIPLTIFSLIDTSHVTYFYTPWHQYCLLFLFPVTPIMGIFLIPLTSMMGFIFLLQTPTIWITFASAEINDGTYL